jgi:hypothetical protein
VDHEADGQAVGRQDQARLRDAREQLLRGILGMILAIVGFFAFGP